MNRSQDIKEIDYKKLVDTLERTIKEMADEITLTLLTSTDYDYKQGIRTGYAEGLYKSLEVLNRIKKRGR